MIPTQRSDDQRRLNTPKRFSKSLHSVRDILRIAELNGNVERYGKLLTADLEDEALPRPLGVQSLLAKVSLPALAPESVVGGGGAIGGVGDLEIADAVRIRVVLQTCGAKAGGSQHL